MIKIILKSLREYKKATIVTPIFIIFEVLCEVAIPFMTKELVTEMQVNGAGIAAGDIKKFALLCTGLVILAMLGLAFGFLAAKFAAEAQSGLAKNLRKDMYYKIQEFSFENIDKFSASSLVTRMTTDVSNVQMAYGMVIRSLVRSPLMVIFSTIMCFLVNPTLAWIYVGLIPVVIILFGLIIKFASWLADERDETWVLCWEPDCRQNGNQFSTCHVLVKNIGFEDNNIALMLLHQICIGKESGILSLSNKHHSHLSSTLTSAIALNLDSLED